MQEFIELSHSLNHKAASDLSIHNIGYEACRAGYHYGPRICPYHIIHFVTKGCGTLYIQQISLQIQAGDAFLIPAEKIAAYEASSSDPWNYAWVGFLGANSDHFFHQLTSSTEETYVLHHLDTKKYAGLIRPAAHKKEATTENYYSVNGTLFQIFAELSKDILDKEPSSRHTKLADEIRYYLEMKYSESLVLSEVAHQLGIHPNYLTAVFRKEFGITPKQFLIGLKMKKACQLLSNTDLPIGFISQTLGFEDQMAFSKLFRKETSMTPSVYRKQTKDQPVPAVLDTVNDFVTYVT